MSTIKKILFTSDLGETTEVLMSNVSYLAKRFSAEVVLVHAMDGGFYFSDLPYDFVEVSEGRVLNELGKLKEKLVEQGIQVTQTIVEIGDSAKVILKTAKNSDADLIILGARKKGLFEKLVGSTAENVIRTANRPVWVTHPTDTCTEINNILCAIDCTVASNHTLQTAIDFSRHLQTTLTVLHCYRRPRFHPGLEDFDIPITDWGADTMPDGYLDIIKDEGGYEDQCKKLKNHLNQFDFRGVEFKQLVKEGAPSEAIHEVAKETACDLLVLGIATGSGPLSHIFSGTMDKIVRTIPCPILTVNHLTKSRDTIATSERKTMLLN